MCGAKELPAAAAVRCIGPPLAWEEEAGAEVGGKEVAADDDDVAVPLAAPAACNPALPLGEVLPLPPKL